MFFCRVDSNIKRKIDKDSEIIIKSLGAIVTLFMGEGRFEGRIYTRELITWFTKQLEVNSYIYIKD